MSLLSDSLLAVGGLFPKAITPRHHVEAAGLPQRWEKRLRAWLNAEEQRPMPDREAPGDMEKLFAKLAAPPDAAELAPLIEGIGIDNVELVTDYTVGLQRARAYLVNIWPSTSLNDSVAGLEIFPLAVDEALDMEAVYRVLNDAGDQVLVELEQWTFEPAQAEAFKACMPDLWAWTSATLERLLAEKRAKDRDWWPRYEQETQVRTLRCVPPEEPFTPPAPAPPPPAPAKMNTDKVRTQAELAVTPVGRENAAGSF